MVLESLPIGFLLGLGKDAFNGVRRRIAPMSADEALKRRERWKPLFEELLLTRWRDGLRTDVIIRDTKRRSEYPNINPKSRRQTWMRQGLLNSYHDGLLMVDGWHDVTQTVTGEYRFLGRGESRYGRVRAALTGSLPYENIESVDLEGDQIYGFPIIFCRFGGRYGPYSKLELHQKHSPEDLRPYVTFLGALEDVKRTSKRYGVAA